MEVVIFIIVVLVLMRVNKYFMNSRATKELVRFNEQAKLIIESAKSKYLYDEQVIKEEDENAFFIYRNCLFKNKMNKYATYIEIRNRFINHPSNNPFTDFKDALLVNTMHSQIQGKGGFNTNSDEYKFI